MTLCTVLKYKAGPVALVSLLCGTAAIPAAHAASLEEVIVTAQKREQRLQDVGISVTAVSGEQVKELGIRGLADVAAQTPSLSVAAPFGLGGNQNFTLRGVGLNDFSEHNESPVATYQDGVYQATIAGINAALFDVDRIEVLRGPQGTLYGRNSTGGLVQYFSKQPTTTWEGFADAGIGSYSQKRFEGAIGGPISDTLLFRVSALVDRHKGLGESTQPGVKDPFGLSQLGGRVMLKWLASSDTSLLLNLHAATNHDTGTAYTIKSTMYAPDGVTQIFTPPDVVNPYCDNSFGLQGPGQDCFGYRNSHPNNPWLFDGNRQSFQNLDTHGASLTLNSKLFGADFVSISAYERVHKLYGDDSDGGPFPAVAVTNPVESKQFTQELRLSNKYEQMYWTTGLYYFYRNIKAGSDTNLSGVGFVDDEFRDQQRSKSAALFGQLEYSLTPQVTLIGGLRYSYEDQNFELLSVDHTGLTPVFLGITTDPIPGYNVFPFTGGTTADLTPYRNTRRDNLITYRGEVDYRPVDDFMVYGSISKGTKSAGWNAAIDGSGVLGASTAEQMPYSPENLLAYEVGFKHEADFYRLNGAAFYYDYKNFQAFTFTGLTQQISNLPASVKGAELEFVVSPNDHFDLTLGGSWLSTRVQDVITPVADGTGATVTADRQMVLAPKYSINGIARYHFRIAGDNELAFQVDSRYTGKQYFDLINSPISTENGRAVTNASISLADADNRWTASVSVKNLTDRQYRVYAVPVTFLGQMQEMYGTPRWYGVTVGYKW